MTATAATRVILVHGWAGSAEMWEPVVRAFERHESWEPVLFRLAGSPRSGLTGPISIESESQRLVDLARMRADRVVLVGHSMGAQLTLRAQAYAADAVLGEVVIDPAYGAEDASAPAMAAWADRIEQEGHDAVTDFFAAASKGLHPDDASRVIDDLHATPPRIIADYLRAEYVWPDAVGLAAATAAAAARRERPTLAFYSSADAARRERELPSSAGTQIRLWGGSGHFLQLEDPARFVDELITWATPLRAPAPATAQVAPA